MSVLNMGRSSSNRMCTGRSCGSVLQRFDSLRSKTDQFLKEKDRPLHVLSDSLRLAYLAFLVDLTDHLHSINKSLQGKDQFLPQL